MSALSTPSRGSLVFNVALLAVFGLLFAYDLWEALGNLVLLSGYAASLDIGIVWWGWVVLVGSALLPLVLLAVAARISWRRPLAVKLAVYFLALCVSAASYLSIITLFNDSNLLAI